MQRQISRTSLRLCIEHICSNILTFTICVMTLNNLLLYNDWRLITFLILHWIKRGKLRGVRIYHVNKFTQLPMPCLVSLAILMNEISYKQFLTRIKAGKSGSNKWSPMFKCLELWGSGNGSFYLFSIRMTKKDWSMHSANGVKSYDEEHYQMFRWQMLEFDAFHH